MDISLRPRNLLIGLALFAAQAAVGSAAHAQTVYQLTPLGKPNSRSVVLSCGSPW